jgi:hypothetical protein
VVISLSKDLRQKYLDGGADISPSRTREVIKAAQVVRLRPKPVDDSLGSCGFERTVDGGKTI